MAVQTVARGYVVVYRQPLPSGTTCSAVVSGPTAKRLQQRQGGRIVNARGLKFRFAQQRQLRVLVDPALAAALPTAEVR